jgi:hypothetical protein
MSTDECDHEHPHSPSAGDAVIAKDVVGFVRQCLLDTLDPDDDVAVAQGDLWDFLADGVLGLTPCQCEELQGIWFEYSRNFWLIAKDVLSGAVATDRHRQQLLVKMRIENDDKILVQEFTDIVLNLLKRINWERETIPGSHWCEIESPSEAIGSYWYCKRDGSVKWLRPEIETESMPPRIEDYIDEFCSTLDAKGTKQIQQDVLWRELGTSALALNAVQVQDIQRGWWEHTQQFWETATQITGELQEQELLELKSKLSVEASEFILLQEFALVLPQLLTQITCDGTLHEDRWCEIPVNNKWAKSSFHSNFWFDKKSGQSSWTPPSGLMASAAVPTAEQLLQSTYALELLDPAAIMDAYAKKATKRTTAIASEVLGGAPFEIFFSHRFGAGFRQIMHEEDGGEGEREGGREGGKRSVASRQDGVVVLQLPSLGAVAYLQEEDVEVRTADAQEQPLAAEEGQGGSEGWESVCDDVIECIIFELQIQWQRDQQMAGIGRIHMQIEQLVDFDASSAAQKMGVARSIRDSVEWQEKQASAKVSADGETPVGREVGTKEGVQEEEVQQEEAQEEIQEGADRAEAVEVDAAEANPRQHAFTRRQWQMIDTGDAVVLQAAALQPELSEPMLCALPALDLPVARERRWATDAMAKEKAAALLDAVTQLEEKVVRLDEVKALMAQKRAEVEEQKEARAQLIARLVAEEACRVGMLALADILKSIETMNTHVEEAEGRRLRNVLAAAAAVSLHAADATQSSYGECRGWVAVAMERSSCAVAASVALHAGAEASAAATHAHIGFYKARAARAARWAASAAIQACTLSSMLAESAITAATKAATKEAAGFASEMAMQALALAERATGEAWEAADAVTAAAAALGALRASEAAAMFTRMAEDCAFKCTNPHSLKIEMASDGGVGVERRAGVALEIVVQAVDGYGNCMHCTVLLSLTFCLSQVTTMLARQAITKWSCPSNRVRGDSSADEQLAHSKRVGWRCSLRRTVFRLASQGCISSGPVWIPR